MNELTTNNNQNWYTIEELASMCGYSSAHAIQSNPNVLEILNQFSNSNDVKMGGYHNTKKFYSENVLKALKQYQLRNSAPNALQNKEAAITGNISFVANEARSQTIAAILSDPKALMELALQSSQRLLEAEQKIEVVEAKNEALASDVLTWADRKVIQAIINKYGANRLNGDFALAWSEYKKELNYKHAINLNARVTAYYNRGGKKSKLKVLELLDDSELPAAVKTAIAIAESNHLDISDIVSKTLDAKKGRLTLWEAAKNAGADVVDVVGFLKLRGYVRESGDGKVEATALGSEAGVVKNTDNGVLLTKIGADRIKKAFGAEELSEEERKRIDAICLEAEKKARYNGVGRDE